MIFAWYAHDHLYSPVALINPSGNAIERYEYDAYGRCCVLDPNFTIDADGLSDYDNPYLFTGRRWDTLNNGSLKIQYSRNRYYDYQTGRFLSHDPLGITPNHPKPNMFNVMSQYKDGMNLYEYVRSNPVIKVDPKGLESCGYKVDCGDIHVDSWWDRIGDSLGGYHCDLNNTSKPNERENARSYPVWVDRDKTCNRTLMGGENKGKACLCATCSDITDCVDAVWKKIGQGKTPTLNDNCHTWAAAQISRCCLKTTWDPAWFAGDFTCTKWAYVGGPIMRRICIERSPSIN